MEITVEDILLDVLSADRDDLIRTISDIAVKRGYTLSASKLFDAFIDREMEYSTGLQDGFAIPHAKSDAVERAGVIYARLRQPIEWKTYDDAPVTDVFALMVPEQEKGTIHLQMLGNLANALLEDDFKTQLRALDDEAAIAGFITEQIGVEVS
ncbi:putative PTS IIA-like nitrogen-regulatory protein PtsN [Coriobacterium glomerans PW2]|uniref:PTS IIA-like nitrogen-regulatory protein PtsN n=1 Tax=Coriobacterium glomerans (strain ATCC 49209 / DSM 20642 / JCM 10262 / PW2) TaxID=700015 RepID=F2NB34_CORGP|nr:PTS sugar transporter subunit IIA [Coriobacterium glomerans]AEB07785.1 putative PTS IIA-like nitrogen-regulatory protein PtsN [Coriobacterium glomerans PW2]